MSTQVLTALIEGDAAEVNAKILAAIEAQFTDAPPRLLVVFASPLQPLDALTPALSKALPETVVLGSSSAGEFTEEREIRGGVSVFALGGDYVVKAGIGKNLAADVHSAVAQSVESLPASVDGFPHQTGLVLLDTLAGVGEEASLLATVLLGEGVRLVGGAAGDHDMTATHVAFGEHVATDAIVVAKLFSRVPLGLGVSNGHAPLSRELEVTRAEGNVIYEIEGRPAWTVWKEMTREHAMARGINPDELSDAADLFKYLVVYEAGLSNGEGFKMRSPLIRQDDDSLAFACGVPEGAVIRIMESDAERQINSARVAARAARDQLGGAPLAGALIFDCICRKTILGDAFEQALEAIHETLEAPFAGFETYGEVALDIDEMSGFHNTTTVVLAFPS